MRAALLYNPRLLLERVVDELRRRARLRRLRGTVAATNHPATLAALELLELAGADAPPPRVVYDIGAEVGTSTLLIKALFPDAEVHAFEPLRAHQDDFRRRTAGLPGVTLHAVALGARAGALPMHVTARSDSSSFLTPTSVAAVHGVAAVDRATLPVVVLEEYAAAHGLPAPDLIKIDVQGYELEALSGAATALAHARHVVCEVSFVELYRGQPLFADVVAFFAAAGFRLTAVGVETALGRPLVQTDVLFSR